MKKCSKKQPFILASGLVATLLFVGAGCSAYKTANSNANTSNDNVNAAPEANANAAANPGAEKIGNANTTLKIQNINVGSAGNTNAAPAANTGASRSNASAAQSVSIKDFAFSAASLSVPAGTTVTWTNMDTVEHTVNGDNGGPASSSIAPQSTYSYTFSTPGTYPYHCAPHPYMTGTITVTQ